MLARNSSRIYLERWVRRAAESTPSGASVLDAGAGDAPYRHLWRHVDYRTADFGKLDKPYSELDFVCDLSSIPVPDASFDTVLSTQVLEHLPDPRKVLVEFARVLKPGGQLWLSAPLFYEEHEVPFDFHRYTQFGLREHIEQAGLVVEQIDWLEGFLGTVSYEALTISSHFPRRPSQFGGGAEGAVLAGAGYLLAAFTYVLWRVLAAADLRYRITDTGFPKNYTVLAVKPGRSGA
jgi:SAM-dependent methyltransferase